MVIWTYGKGPLSKRDETCCHHYMGCSLIRKDILYAPSHKEEGNVLFNNALNTFYLRLCGITHMVKNHSDREKGNPLLPHGLLFPISSKHHPRQVNTYHSLCYTSHGSLAGTRNSSKGSSHHEQTLLPRSYILPPSNKDKDSTYHSIFYTSSEALTGMSDNSRAIP